MNRRLTASKMPRLRAALQDQCDKFSATNWEPAFATFSQAERALAKKVRAIDLQNATLWWVRPDMARLAWDAAQTLPEGTRLLEAIPAPKGIIIWEGDPLLSGILVARPHRGYQAPRPIQGAVWEVTARGVEIATLIHEPPESLEIRYIPLYSYQYIGQMKKNSKPI